jgi:hypothetical protein
MILPKKSWDVQGRGDLQLCGFQRMLGILRIHEALWVLNSLNLSRDARHRILKSQFSVSILSPHS